MDDKGQVARAAEHGPRGQHAVAHEQRRKPKINRIKRIFISIGIILGVAIIVLAGLFFYRTTTGSTIDSSKYQAVFLNSGAVYFGKLQVVNSNYFKLTDVYYLQTQSTDATKQQPAASSTSTNLQLTKLGSELQGPTDEMIVNRDQVTFFENLKSDGKLTQSIVKYQSK